MCLCSVVVPAGLCVFTTTGVVLANELEMPESLAPNVATTNVYE